MQRPVELAQYRAVRSTERLDEAAAVASVGSKGDSYDNALAEAFNMRRLHSALGHVAPAEFEALHAASPAPQTTP